MIKIDISFVSDYTYLGVIFACNGNFGKSINMLKNQASRAMFALLSKSRKLGLEVDVQLQLFDSLVVHIATYGCEVWGFRNIEVIERLHLQLCKYILRVGKSTPTDMVLGELGRMPLQYTVWCRMLGFWYRMLTGNKNKISCIMYKLLLNLDIDNVLDSEWLNKIQYILNECGMSEMWINQDNVRTMSFVQFKNLYKDKLKKYFVEQWLSSLEQSTKCSLYRNFKTDLVVEKYIVEVKEPFRTNLVKLPIEKGGQLKEMPESAICVS